MASSPAIVICTVYHMYSLSISVGDDGFTCDKCREIVRLTERVLELETCIQTLVEDSKNLRAVDTALDVTSSGTPVHCSVPASAPVQQGNWVTERRHSRGSKHRSSVPIRTSNRFSPLSDALLCLVFIVMIYQKSCVFFNVLLCFFCVSLFVSPLAPPTQSVCQIVDCPQLHLLTS